MGAGDLTDVERPKIGDDIYQHPHRPQLPVMDPQDGMPRVISALSMEDSKAPPLSPETFICMADDSCYVIRDHWGDVQSTFAPDRVKRYGDGWVVGLTEPEVKDLEDRGKHPGITVAGSAELWWYQVEPLRPQCDFYKRVMTDFENTDSKGVERVCTAQRTDSGEFLSLRDQRVYACEHRSPRDFVSEERLRKFDENAMALAKKTDEEWDGEAALAALSPGKTP